MSLTLDIPSPLALTGDITSVQLLDNDSNPNRVVDTDAGFSVIVRWHVQGSMLPYLGGDWTVKCFVESIGAGFEGMVGLPNTQPVTNAQNYSATINVAPHTIPPAPGDDTVYQLVALVSHRNHGAKTEIAGFADARFFEVRNP